ncbi:MAG TPA: hypothetical protein VFK44_02725 [Bacillales bacterium]|nr:hypothetical protein [Bacillales bacterium]
MLIASLILFAAAAVGGLILAVRHFKQKELPMPLAVIHGLAAAIALVLLIFVVFAGSGNGFTVVALVLFIVAAVFGFLLFSLHLRKQKLKTGLLSSHAIVAVAAFLLLLIGIVM